MLLFAGEHRVTDGWFRVELDINPLYDQREIPRLGPGYQYTPSGQGLKGQEGMCTVRQGVCSPLLKNIVFAHFFESYLNI